MSVTRILCDHCGYPLAWCACKKPDAPLVDGASESRPREARCAVAGGFGPLNAEEQLTLKVAELLLHRDQVDLAARVLLRGRRTASKHQDLVLREDLEDFVKKLDAAKDVTWPNVTDEPCVRASPPVGRLSNNP